MAFIIKFFKGVRTHWKKSTFAAIAVTYGINSVKEHFETTALMREYCEEAAKFGHVPIAVNENPKTVTVILNPNADRRKAAKNFEKYCAPILHLAGLCVDIIQTESEGHAKTLIDTLGYTDAIVVAGGDGLLSEVVTGLLRRCERDKDINLIPIGVLPLGRSSKVANCLFPGGESLTQVKSLADASLAVVKEFTKPVDVMKIELLDTEPEEQPKPIYAVGSFEWGAFRDAEVKTDKYWYFGPLRSYATYLFNGYKNSLTWNCEADINYTLPCSGCSSCFIKPPELHKRWYHKFIPYQRPKNYVDLSQFENEKCSEMHEKPIISTNIELFTSNIFSNETNTPKLRMHIGPKDIGYWNFVSRGFATIKGSMLQHEEVIEAKQLELKPAKKFNNVEGESDEKKNHQQHYFYIDKEEFDVRPIRITLLPRIIRMFCKEQLPG